MVRNQHDDRKRALVMGKYKLLYQDDTEDLVATDKFKLAVTRHKLLGPVIYRSGLADPDIKIPGALKVFTVVWTNPFGDIFLDSDIKLYEFEDVQKYSAYNDGPKSPEFCRFYSSSNSKELDGFDSSIFWSAGFLWEHLGTCGVEAWDLELQGLVGHYRNWREWVHNVHHRSTGQERGEDRRSGHYGEQEARSQDRRMAAPPHFSVAPPAMVAPAPAAAAPPYHPAPAAAAPLYLPGPARAPLQQATAAPLSRFSYINPRRHIPPPLAPPRKSSWSHQVDAFLSTPTTAHLGPPPVQCSTPQKRPPSPSIDDRKGKKFRPKASILPPSPGRGSDVNPLDTQPGETQYRGVITDWRSKFGFMVSDGMEGKVFLHSKDITEGRVLARVGAEAVFQVLHQESSVVGAKAVNVKIQK